MVRRPVRRWYAEPRIAEAVLAAGMYGAPVWAPESYARLAQRFKGFGAREEKLAVDAPLARHGAQAAPPAQGAPHRVWRLNQDGHRAVQYGPGVVSYNVLAPYGHFEDHLPSWSNLVESPSRCDPHLRGAAAAAPGRGLRTHRSRGPPSRGLAASAGDTAGRRAGGGSLALPASNAGRRALSARRVPWPAPRLGDPSAQDPPDASGPQGNGPLGQRGSRSSTGARLCASGSVVSSTTCSAAASSVIASAVI